MGNVLPLQFVCCAEENFQEDSRPTNDRQRFNSTPVSKGRTGIDFSSESTPSFSRPQLSADANVSCDFRGESVSKGQLSMDNRRDQVSKTSASRRRVLRILVELHHGLQSMDTDLFNTSYLKKMLTKRFPDIDNQSDVSMSTFALSNGCESYQHPDLWIRTLLTMAKTHVKLPRGGEHGREMEIVRLTAELCGTEGPLGIFQDHCGLDLSRNFITAFLQGMGMDEMHSAVATEACMGKWSQRMRLAEFCRGIIKDAVQVPEVVEWGLFVRSLQSLSSDEFTALVFQLRLSAAICSLVVERGSVTDQGRHLPSAAAPSTAMGADGQRLTHLHAAIRDLTWKFCNEGRDWITRGELEALMRDGPLGRCFELGTEEAHSRVEKYMGRWKLCITPGDLSDCIVGDACGMWRGVGAGEAGAGEAGAWVVLALSEAVEKWTLETRCAPVATPFQSSLPPPLSLRRELRPEIARARAVSLEAALVSLFRAIDVDGDGEINATDLVSLWSRNKLWDHGSYHCMDLDVDLEERAEEIVQIGDDNDDGNINVGNFLSVAAVLERDPHPDIAALCNLAAVAAAGVDADAYEGGREDRVLHVSLLNPAEYAGWLYATWGLAELSTSHGLAVSGPERQRAMRLAASEIFRYIDVDCDGFVGENDVGRFFSKMGPGTGSGDVDVDVFPDVGEWFTLVARLAFDDFYALFLRTLISAQWRVLDGQWGADGEEGSALDDAGGQACVDALDRAEATFASMSPEEYLQMLMTVKAYEVLARS